MDIRFTKHMVCPWCHKGEILADDKAKVAVSVECPKCHKFFIGNLDSLKTERSIACKRLGRKK